jgi:hypothetical protein
MWAESKMGPQKVKDLHTKAHLTLKLSKADKAFIAAHYRSELKRLNALRAKGHTGYIPLTHWGESDAKLPAKPETLVQRL